MIAYASTIISLIAFLYYGVLFFIILRQNIRSRIRLYFGGYLLSMMIWSFASFMMFSGISSLTALFWNRALVVGSIAMPVLFYGFVAAFLMKDRRFWLYLCLALYLLIELTNLLGYLIVSARVENGLLYNEYGPASLALSGFSWVFFISLSFVELVIAYRNSRDVAYRNRLRYLYLVIVVIFAGTLTNLVYPLKVFPSDVAFNILSALLITFAILRHHLLDISVVVRKGLLYSIPTVIIGASYYLVIWLAALLFRENSSLQIFLMALIVAIITAIAAQPLRDKAQAWIDRLFFREKYDAGLMLQRVSRTGASVLDLDKLARMILAEVTSTLHISHAAVLLRREETAQFHLVAQEGLDLKTNLRLGAGHPLVQALTETDQPLLQSDLAVMPRFRALWVQERSALDKIGAELYIPLKASGRLVGIFIVGPKRSEQNYSADDQLLLTTLADQVVVAIENARLYHAEQSRREELDALYRLNRQLIATDEVAAVVQSTTREAVESVHVTFSRLLVLDQDGRLVCRAVYPITELDSDLGLGRVEPAESMDYYNKALQQTDPVVLSRDNPLLEDEAAQTLFPGNAASICLAGLRVGERAIGVLVLGERRNTYREPFDGDKLRLVVAIADQAASALQRAYLHEQMEESFLQTVLALANAMDARDTYTGNHSQRLAELADALCRELKIDEAEMRVIHWGALLHDIGKIGVPDEILRKPGPLTEEEWAIMKRHPEIGARIVAPVKKLADVAPIIRAHQERYDGSGYPDGLKGAQIPRSARLLAVVDAYGAMIDERVYRRPLGHERAVAELVRGKGVQFDPLMVDAFLRMLERERDKFTMEQGTVTRPLRIRDGSV